MAILTRVMHTAPLADIIDHTETDKRLGHWLSTASPAELRAYIRNYLETLYHPTSTARMAPLSDGGVVDARLRVHGVQGLRVVDASIFPTIISGHTVRDLTVTFISHICLLYRVGTGGRLTCLCMFLWLRRGWQPLCCPHVQSCASLFSRYACRGMTMADSMDVQAGTAIAVAEKAADLIFQDLALPKDRV
jgi:hypothetical protein